MSEEKIVLTAEHIKAVNRERRILVQDGFGDAYFDRSEEYTDDDLEKALAARFSMLDDVANQIDTIIWCWEEGNEAPYQSRVLPRRDHCTSKWWDVGFDPIKSLVEGTKERDREAFYSYRIQGSHEGPDHAAIRKGPLKMQHEDWLMRTSKKPRWNFALKEVRDMKLAVLQELAAMYDFDGFQIDFTRHPWVFEAGEQWKNRDLLTDFMRSFRMMLLTIEKRRNRPYLAAARVPENLMGCHFDGIDIERWIEEGLVDMLILSERNASIDIEAFRQLIKDKPIKLYPSWNYEANVVAYDENAMELWRGAHANWWRQGADGVHAFNIGAFPAPERYLALGFTQPFVREWRHQSRILQEVGDPETLKYKDKIFYVPLRNYGVVDEPTPRVPDWRTPRDFYCMSLMFEALPATIANNGKVDTLLTIDVADDVNALARMVENITLRLLISDLGAKDLPADTRLKQEEAFQEFHRLEHVPPQKGVEKFIAIRVNNLLLTEPAQVDGGWIQFPVEPYMLAVGKNLIGITVKECPIVVQDLRIEKAELRVGYFKHVPETKHPEHYW